MTSDNYVIFLTHTLQHFVCRGFARTFKFELNRIADEKDMVAPARDWGDLVRRHLPRPSLHAGGLGMRRPFAGRRAV